MDTHEPEDTVPARDGGAVKMSPQDARKAALREAEHIREVRARLYARGETLSRVPHHAIPPQLVRTPTPPIQEARPVVEEVVEDTQVTHSSDSPSTALQNAVSYTETMAHRRTFRKTIAYISIFFFVAAAAVASFIMFTGHNTISGENISLEVSGQNLSSAGEVLPLKVTISNQNVVPIQSATLIIEYPQGTQNTSDGKEMTIERKSLDSINSGEIVNVELGARVFGAENEEKEIKVSIEYRISGSNGTFNKKAEPFHFKIGTAPIVLSFNALKVITTGQEYVLPLTVQSNTNVPLTDVLVKISYPNGFDFTSATPNTSSGEDTWRIPTLKPGEKKVITVKGIVTGDEHEGLKFLASTGIADATNNTLFTTTLMQTQSEVKIERPFLNTKISVQGQGKEVSVVEKNGLVDVRVTLENTLDTIVYDGKLSVEIQGSPLNEFSVDVTNGFYNSMTNTITWDATDAPFLKEIIPGNPIEFNFTLKLNDNYTAPSITLVATAQGQRVFEDKVPERLEGITKKVVKVVGTALVGVETVKKGPFENSGPIPPVAEQTTTYSLHLTAKAGSNNLSNAELVAELPQYIKWLDTVTEGDSVSYNSNTRMIKWDIGKINAYSTQDATIQISFTPSMAQVGTSPLLIEGIAFTAVDEFTGFSVKNGVRDVTADFDGEYLSGQVRSGQ